MARKRTVAIVTGVIGATIGVLTVPWQALADQVLLDDLIVDGSTCVGFDCVNGESFGFDTIRLKENNLRIRAVDTSSTASFPSNDWQITFNDSSNGGQNKFSIDDIDGGRTPFTIEAGAATNGLYLDDGGRLGLGTNIPAVELEIVDGDTPTVRLKQDGSSGFTPQTWDMAGNETNFFIRDATNGSKLPFRIQPNSPGSSIFVKTDRVEVNNVLQVSGEINIGHTDPADDLLDMVGDGKARVRFNNTAATDGEWVFGVNASGNLLVARVGSALTEFQINNSTGEITVGGDLTVVGALTTSSCSGC